MNRRYRRPASALSLRAWRDRRRCCRPLLPRRAALALADVFEQLDLDLLDLEEAIVLPPQQMIDLLVQVPDLELGFEVDLVIILRPQSVARLGTVLAHHDDGRLERG